MGLLSILGIVEPTEQKSVNADRIDVLLDNYFGSTLAKSGQAVNLQTALEVPVVLGCARVIAEGVAQVPFKVYQRTANGGRVEARDHPLFRLLHRRPNEWQTSFEFREQIALHLVLSGNAFIFISRRANGEVLELLPYEPSAVTVKRNTDLSLDYTLRLRSGETTRLPRENMWHIRGASWNGYLGMDSVHLARNSIGLSLATEEFGSSLFKNGARPGGILTSEQSLKPEVVSQIRDSWKASQEGSGNAMKTAVLHGGLKYQPLSFNADEAQFNETQKRAVHSICAAFRVNPIMVMQTEGTATYASVEQMFLAHVTHTLMPWYERIEQSAEVNLLTDREADAGYYVKLEAKGLMRGTAKERAEFNQILLQNGVVSRNEVRASEDMDLVSDPAFDVPRPAANLYGDSPPPPEG